MIPAETMPPMTAPNGKPQNISATRVPRSFAGAYSEVTEMMPGNAPPRPNPVTSLTIPKTGRDDVKGVIDVVAANNATAAIKAGLRPNRSPQMPNTSAPTKLPNSPAPNTMPKRDGATCQATRADHGHRDLRAGRRGGYSR